ncbi:MAG: hypothetical protein WCE30_10175 [Mycobacterium sp.]
MAAVLRVARETVRRAKMRIAELSGRRDSHGASDAMIKSAWQAQDEVLAMAGERLGLVQHDQ